MKLWPWKEVIHRDGDPYLTRWHLLHTRWGRLYLHRFHRSDDDVLHDHPWSFWSLILRGGYAEVTPGCGLECDLDDAWCSHHAVWYWPGSLLRRPATWAHRVVIPDHLRGKVWTLVWTGPKVRSWGFHCPNGWVYWLHHHRRRQAGGDGC